MRFKKTLTALLIAMVALSAVAPAVSAASNFNDDADAAQNPYIAADVTVSSFDRADMSVGEYEDDSGEIAQLPAVVDQSDDVDDIGSGTVNPYKFVATDIEFSDAARFPTDKESVSAIHNESEWTTAGLTVSDASTAPGVEALEVSSSGLTSGSTASATYDNVSITSDAEKRYLQVALDVVSMDSGATVELRAMDSDGDYVDVYASPSASATDDNVLATGTGEGFVIQEQMGSLTVEGSGDGTLAEIQSIEVVVSDADATVRMSALNAQKTSEWTFGDKRVNTDDEDDFETESITDVSSAGAIAIYNLDTMGSTFDNAVINGLTVPMKFSAGALEDESEVNVTFTSADSYPSFSQKMTSQYKLELPDAYDLSYANAELRQESQIPNSRYQSVELYEGVGDTDFSEISSWTIRTDAIGAVDNDVVLDNTIQPGQQIAYQSIVLVTDQEASQVQDVSAGAGQFGSSSGGIFDMILSPIGAVVGAVLAFLGLRGGE